MDHNVPTEEGPVTDPLAKAQLDALRRNCEEFGVPLFATGSGREGIVHVIGPELGLTQPGMTIVCGDSHTATHGAFGALAFGVGTSEVEHVLATQCLPQTRPLTMRVRFEGELPAERDGEGHDPRRDRPARRGRRDRARARVHGRGDSRPDDGEPDDDLQHVDRGRGTGGDDRARRDDVRVSRRPARRADRSRVGAGARRLAHARIRPRRRVRQRVHDRRRRARPAGHLGDEPGDGRAGHRPRARSGRLRRSRPAARRRAGAHLHGPRAGHGDAGHLRRPRLHRLVHECADRGPARRRGRRRGQAGPSERPGARRAGVGDGQADRRGGRARPDLRRRRLRVAPRGVLDVPRHESRRARGRRALRLDLEPQLRGPAGTRRPHAPGQPAARGGDGDRRPLRRPPRAGDTA